MDLDAHQIAEKAKPLVTALMNTAEGHEAIVVITAASALVATYLAAAAIQGHVDVLPGCKMFSEEITKMAQEAHARIIAAKMAEKAQGAT